LLTKPIPYRLNRCILEQDSIATQEASLVPQADLLKEAEIALGSSKEELEEHLSSLNLDK